MRAIKGLVFTIAICVFLGGCSKSPSNGDLDRAFENYATNNGVDGVLLIENIRKTNGYLLDGIYTVEISFERHFLIGIDEAIANVNKNTKAAKSSNIAENMALGLVGLMSGTGFLRLGFIQEYGEFSAGDIQYMTHQITFIETENGWQVYN
ncbi:MAG: hypothetical protein WA981_06520 [Glaciecola sp.]